MKQKKKNREPVLIVLFLVLAVALTGSLYAQSSQASEREFPAGNFWSLDGGLGWGGMMEYGKSFYLTIEPKLWLSPPLMVGARAAMYYSFEGDAPHPDPDATSDVLFFDGQVYLRWNFLRLGNNPARKTNIFLQGGVGLVAAYRGDENPFDDKTKRRGSLLADGALGLTVPLTDRWHIEGMVHGGFPHIVGVSLTAGYKFPLPGRTTEYVEVLKTVPPIEIIKVLRISSVEFILFGPDIASYNVGVERDGQALNDLVLNSTAEFLKEHPDYIVRIEGNANPVTTDPKEAEELMALSYRRSITVMKELEKRGVPKEQMHIMAFGGTRTVTSDRDWWDKNRRVELIILNADTGAE